MFMAYVEYWRIDELSDWLSDWMNDELNSQRYGDEFSNDAYEINMIFFFLLFL